MLTQTVAPVRAADRPAIIRDVEIETTLHSWARPVIEAADLDPQAVKFVLVKDNRLNAFVAGGQNVFLFTGLLREAEDPSEIIGVIAHELGHIRGGHLVRTRQALEHASYEAIIGTLLGLAGALVTGEGGFAAAMSAGAQSAAQRRFFAYSRTQESSADQAALTYLDKAEMSPEGLVSFMKKLEDQELLPAAQQSEYVRTHPLTRERISALKSGLERSDHAGAGLPAGWQKQFRRMQAKLVGFISPEQVSWQYDDSDDSIAAQYARAIAAYREDRVEEALTRIDDLLEKEPQNPFFLELKGQMLVDFGRVEEALPSYKKAVDIAPGAALIRIAYGHALIESASGSEEKLKNAVQHLQFAARTENRSPRVYRLLATAYGRLGMEPLAQLYLAEEAVLKQDIAYAKRQASAAAANLEEGSQGWLRAQDILKAVERAETEQDG